MTLDFATLDTLRNRHPAWRLLRSDHAPLVASFLQRVLIAPNVRVMPAADPAEGRPARRAEGPTQYRPIHPASALPSSRTHSSSSV